MRDAPVGHRRSDPRPPPAAKIGVVTPVIAHAGHWIESLLILVPTLGFILWLVVITVRDRRRERREGETT
jgi:hypothetical protein